MRYETPEEFFRIPDGDKRCDWISQVIEEYESATRKFGPFNSAHEGYAVIKEELDELWDEIKGSQSVDRMTKEAIQVAAMALRFLTDCV